MSQAREPRGVVVVCDERRAAMYRLLGFAEILSPSGPGELRGLLAELKGRRDLAAVFVEEGLLAAAGLDFASLNERGVGPVISPIPDSRAAFERDPAEYYKKYVARIIGYELGV